MAAKPSPKKPATSEVICEPGRHIGCMHAKRAAALGAASGGMDPNKAEKK